MAGIEDVKLTKDSLTNIHIMAPLLNAEARDKAMAYMLGLLTGMKHGEEGNAGQAEVKAG